MNHYPAIPDPFDSPHSLVPRLPGLSRCCCVFGFFDSVSLSLHLFALYREATRSQSSQSFKSGRTIENCSELLCLKLPLVLGTCLS